MSVDLEDIVLAQEKHDVCLFDKKDLSVTQIINFIHAIKKGIPDSMTLSELIVRCFNDSRMFDSWFNHLDVMN